MSIKYDPFETNVDWDEETHFVIKPVNLFAGFLMTITHVSKDSRGHFRVSGERQLPVGEFWGSSASYGEDEIVPVVDPYTPPEYDNGPAYKLEKGITKQ